MKFRIDNMINFDMIMKKLRDQNYNHD